MSRVKIFSFREVFALLLLLSLGFQLQAQIEIGAKAGMNLTNFKYTSELDFSTSTLRDAEYRKGLHIGIYGSADLGMISVQPEILFSQKGVNNYSTAGDDWILNYLSIPVLFGFEPIEWFQLQLGPEFSFMLSNKIDVAGKSRARENFFNKTDFGLAIGMSFDWPGPGLLSLRYVHGLGGVTIDDQVQMDERFNNRNRTLQASLAMPFYLWGKEKNL